jgi:hypothetical protein
LDVSLGRIAGVSGGRAVHTQFLWEFSDGTFPSNARANFANDWRSHWRVEDPKKGGMKKMKNQDSIQDFRGDMEIEAIDLGTLEALEEDIVPCTCCGGSCSC